MTSGSRWSATEKEVNDNSYSFKSVRTMSCISSDTTSGIRMKKSGVDGRIMPAVKERECRYDKEALDWYDFRSPFQGCQTIDKTPNCPSGGGC